MQEQESIREQERKSGGKIGIRDVRSKREEGCEGRRRRALATNGYKRSRDKFGYAT